MGYLVVVPFGRHTAHPNERADYQRINSGPFKYPVAINLITRD